MKVNLNTLTEFCLLEANPVIAHEQLAKKNIRDQCRVCPAQGFSILLNIYYDKI